MVFTRLFLGIFDIVFAVFAIVLYILMPSSLSSAAFFVSVLVLVKGLLSMFWSASSGKFYPEQKVVIAPLLDIALGVLIIFSGVYLADLLGVIVIVKGVEILAGDVQGNSSREVLENFRRRVVE